MARPDYLAFIAAFEREDLFDLLIRDGFDKFGLLNRVGDYQGDSCVLEDVGDLGCRVGLIDGDRDGTE